MERLVGFADTARTTAADVNEAGLIAGTADSVNGRCAVVWSDPDTFRVLPDLPGDLSSGAIAINNGGLIVGRALTKSTIGARLWKGGEVFDLNELIYEPNLELIGASDINDAGLILANAFDKTTDPWRAVSVVLTPK